MEGWVEGACNRCLTNWVGSIRRQSAKFKDATHVYLGKRFRALVDKAWQL